MDYLHSISPIEPHQVFDTGCKPVLVHCSDLEFYVCKYNSGQGAADKLMREYVIASFLRIWELSVPDFRIINIKPEHLSASLGIGNVNTACPAFGSWYSRNYKEVDKYLLEMSVTQKRKFIDPSEFLSIAFFDLWTSNDDRHHNNYNLLVSPEEKGYRFVPIDHAACFHTGNQDKINYVLSREESLLSSPLLTKLFKPSDLADQTYIAAIREIWYLCSRSCKQSIEKIINSIPLEWSIDKEKLSRELTVFIFTDDWFEECWKTFLEYIQIILN